MSEEENKLLEILSHLRESWRSEKYSCEVRREASSRHPASKSVRLKGEKWKAHTPYSLADKEENEEKRIGKRRKKITRRST